MCAIATLISVRVGFLRISLADQKVFSWLPLLSLCFMPCSTFALGAVSSMVYTGLIYPQITCIEVYTNSFLATLNARKTITGQIDDVSNMLVSIPSALSNTCQSSIRNKTQKQAISIKIETTREQHGVVANNNSVRVPCSLVFIMFDQSLL